MEGIFESLNSGCPHSLSPTLPIHQQLSPITLSGRTPFQPTPAVTMSRWDRACVNVSRSTFGTFISPPRSFPSTPTPTISNTKRIPCTPRHHLLTFVFPFVPPGGECQATLLSNTRPLLRPMARFPLTIFSHRSGSHFN